MNELKPCPFCNSIPFAKLSVVRGIAIDYIKYRVRCGSCGIEISDSITSGSDTEDLAVVIDRVNAVWNKREVKLTYQEAIDKL